MNRQYMVKHPLRTLGGRFNRLVMRYIYPQRSFITFGPTAELRNVTIRRDIDGQLVIQTHDHGRIVGVNIYDAKVSAYKVQDVLVKNCMFVRREG